MNLKNLNRVSSRDLLAYYHSHRREEIPEAVIKLLRRRCIVDRYGYPFLTKAAIQRLNRKRLNRNVYQLRTKAAIQRLKKILAR